MHYRPFFLEPGPSRLHCECTRQSTPTLRVRIISLCRKVCTKMQVNGRRLKIVVITDLSTHIFILFLAVRCLNVQSDITRNCCCRPSRSPGCFPSRPPVRLPAWHLKGAAVRRPSMRRPLPKRALGATRGGDGGRDHGAPMRGMQMLWSGGKRTKGNEVPV